MKLELWRPLFDLEREWESLVRAPRALRDTDELAFRPSIDVKRTDGELIVSAELPGIDPEKDLEVTLDENYLTIKGEKSEETDVSEEDRYVRERRYGRFVRRIPIPEGISGDEIEAGYGKGVLTIKVSLPRGDEPVEPKKIQVSAEGT